jgi:outer membrane protein OmpA-like peptidoglycan-associated protein
MTAVRYPTTIRRFLVPKSADRSRPVSAAAATVMFGVVLSACCGTGPAPLAMPGCRPTGQVPAGGQSVFAVLTGVSANDQDEALRVERRAAFDQVVCEGFARKAVLIGDVVGDGVGSANLWAKERLETEGPNDLLRRTDATRKREALRRAFEDTSARPSAGATDLLSALAVLHGDLTGVAAEGGVDVLVMSSMLNATAALRLDDPGVLAASPYDLFASVAPLVPSCVGWRLHLVGGGRSPGGGLDSQQAANLSRFWTLLIHRCGGHVVAWQGQLGSFPVADKELPVPEPEVPVNDLGDKVTVGLPGSVLFDLGAAELRPDADPALAKVLTEIERYPTRRVEVGGFTDSTGSAEVNQRLSVARASAVAVWLQDHGVAAARVTATGHGADSPIADNSTELGRQANRRVVVSLPAR